jgi:hypothetical protein
MPVVKINTFDGLATDLDNPPIGSAQTANNLVRYRHRGWLEQPDGYASKYTLPTAGTYETSLAWKDMHNLYVVEHGGQNVTIAVGNYTKVSRYDAGVTIPRFGVWMRPYWSGAAWVDAWLELTEIEIVQLTSLSGSSTLNFADTGKATNYFLNWVVVFEGYPSDTIPQVDTNNYLLIQSSTGTSVTYFGANSDISEDRAAGAKMILCRSFVNKELPTIVKSLIFNYLNEIRLTSGAATTNDISLMGGFRSKTYSWDTTDKSTDRIVLDVGCLDVWRYAVLMETPAAATEVTNPLEAGNYTFKIALGTDDNQIAVAHEGSIDAVTTPVVKYSITSAVRPIATDGNFIYRADASDPRTINKYSATDYTQYVGTPTQCIVTSDANYELMDLLVLGDSLYVLWNLTDSNHFLYLTRIPLATFVKTTDMKVESHEGAAALISARMCTDGTYIYVVAADNTYFVFYVLKYTVALVLVTDDMFLPGGHDDVVKGITSACYDGGFVYAASIATDKTSWLLKVNTALTASIAIDTTTTNYSYPSMCVIGSSLYVSSLVDGATLEKRNVSDLVRTDYWTIAGATDAKLATDGSTLYSYVVGASSTTVNTGVVISGTSGSVVATVVITNTTINMRVIGTTLYGDGFIIDLSPTTFTVSADGTQRIDFKLLVSAGAIPKRMRYAYIYMSKDGAPYYRIKKLDVTVVTNLDTGVVTRLTWDAAAVYNTTAKHFYHRTATSISIKDTDVQVIGAEMNVDMGRTYTHSGVVRYSAGGVVGVKTYIGNFYDVYSSQLFKNKVLVNCVSGEGNQQIDVFEYTNPLNTEYGDGDEIVAIADLNERVAVLRKRSLILLTLNNGTYERELIAKDVGCASQESVVSFNDEIFWADYNGLHSFSGRGLKTLNLEWIEDWKALTDDQKEATCSAIDRVNKLWIVNTRNATDDLLLE